MRKWLLSSVLLASALAFSACGNANSNNDPAASSPANTANESNASNGSNGNAPTNESASPSYFGDWIVKGVAGSGEVSTLPDDGIIGTKATYSSDKAVVGTEEIPNPAYKEEEMTKEEFISDFRVKLKDLGIDADSVKTVKIGDATGRGTFLLVKDAQTLIFPWDGNFYEMRKAS